MKFSKLHLNSLAIIFCLVFCVSCAKKPPQPIPVPQQEGMIQDIRNFPQNLEVYANQYGANKLLLSGEEQGRFARTFERIFFGPWEMSRTTISKRSVSGLFRHARGYKDGVNRWTQPEWDAMLENAQLGSFPSMAAPAITLRNTDLRELPTHTPRFSDPTPDARKDPFDNFQYSLLQAGMPVFLTHSTRDGKWFYVECPIAGGWVDAQDVARVDSSFINEWRLNNQFLALVKDKTTLPGTGKNGGDSASGIGVLLPFRGKNSDGSFKTLIPVRTGLGMAQIAEIDLPVEAATIWPLPLTPGNAAKIGNNLMNQPYGWGGMLGERDCSATVRDLFTPFGVWLPRNSAAQARRGSVISLTGMDRQEKKNAIMRYGVPFFSLVGMKGHITLYVGEWQGQPAIFHNVWGFRVIRDGNDNNRHVIGRAVVTSITPGLELEDLYRPVTFVDRLRTLTQLGDR